MVAMKSLHKLVTMRKGIVVTLAIAVIALVSGGVYAFPPTIISIPEGDDSLCEGPVCGERD